MKYFKKLVGERIYLSPRSIEDAEVYTKWMNDFEVTDYTGRSATVLTLDAEKKYLDGISSGKSSELMNLTSNYHYHTVSAESEEVLDQLQEELWERGYLAKLQDYEPVEFGKK